MSIVNLGVHDAARLLKVSEKTIYRWIKQEIIPAYRFQGQHRFNQAELHEWATSRRMGFETEVFVEPDNMVRELPSLTEAIESGGIIYRLNGKNRNEVLKNLVMAMNLPEEIDRSYLQKVLVAREELASTGFGGGIAFPHPHQPLLTHISKPMVTLAFLEEPVEFYSLDGQPVQVLFSIISPTLRSRLYLLSILGFACRKPDFLKVLKNVGSRDEIFSELKKIEKSIRHKTF